jgi:hypothetical protein
VSLRRGGWTLSGRDSTFDCRWLEFRSSETADYAASMARVGFHGKVITGGRGSPANAILVFVDGEVLLKHVKSTKVYRSASADTVTYVAVEDGGTKTNVAAVVSFGMAGLGARRKWTVVTVGFPDGDAVMEFRTEVQTMRARMKKAVDACPELEGRIEYGPPPTETLVTTSASSPSEAEVDNALDRLERLTDLLDKGTIDADEFARLKAAIVDDVS